MENKKSEINITFYMVGKFGMEVDFNEISKCLNLTPTGARTPEDWPEAIKYPKNELPDELKPRYQWEFSLQYKECKAVSIRFEKMLEVLWNKEEIINELKKRFKLDTGFIVSIQAQHDQGNLPEVFLTQEIITFTALIGADIGFDMYLY